MAHVESSYREYVDKRAPRAREKALFEPDSRRRKGESMIQYLTHKNVLLKELDRAQCVSPDNAKGYIMMRDSNLPASAWDTVENWSQGTYGHKGICTYLKKLERPIS